VGRGAARHSRARFAVTAVFTALTLLGCGGRGEGGAPGAPCAPPDTSRAPSVDPSELAGTFDVTLHVTDGAQPDTVVEGRLWLRPRVGAGETIPRRLPWILEGRTTLSIAAQGAAAAVLSSDPAAPRLIAGFWDPRERSIALLRTRLAPDSGADGERGVALRAFQTSGGGFRGTWHTAFWTPPLPAGFFCARRVEEDGHP